MLALPGVTELPEGAITFATELQADFSEDRDIEFSVSLISGANIAVGDPVEGEPYSFVVADSGDNAVSVNADASIVQAGAGDDFIEVVGDGETPLPEVETYGSRDLYEFLDWGVPPVETLHHSLFGGEGEDTISIQDATAFIRTSDDSDGDLVQLTGEVTALVEAGANDTVIGSDDARVTQVLLHGDGALFEGGEASEIAAALGDSTLSGGGGFDVLLGSNGAQNLSGGQGNDYLNPNDNRAHSHHSSSVYENMDDQSDTLDGGAGDDILFLSNGDVATGGSGSDSFRAFLDVEHELGGATLSDFDPENETIRIYLSGGDILDEDSIFSGETYDLRGRVESVETPDGNTRILVDGSEIMELTGQTELNVGFLYTSEDEETVWYDLTGNEISSADLHVQISVHENYTG